jgi:Ni,Fe-hydrogenase maturation factor
MSHHVDPAVLVATAKQLYGKAPDAISATVTGECFGFGRELTPEVETAMHGVVQHLKEVISERLQRAQGAAQQ